MVYSFQIMYGSGPIPEYAEIDIEAPSQGEALAALKELVESTNILGDQNKPKWDDLQYHLGEVIYS